MKQWSAMLGTELSDWPQVSSKPMFGMTAFYRADQIFAVLPKTRGFQSSNGVAFRFETISAELAEELRLDDRVLTNPIGKKWITFEVHEAKDVNAVLEWMSRAYENCRKPGAKRDNAARTGERLKQKSRSAK